MSQIDLQWFSAEDEGKTEDPSEHKLKKAREEGRVAKSQELNGSIVMFFAIVLLVILGPWVERNLEEMMIFFFRSSTVKDIFDGRFAIVFARYFLMMVIPFCLVGVLAGVLINIIQNKGFLFTTKTIAPKFDKILPKFGQYFKRTMFSFEGVFNIFKSLLKVAVLSTISYLTVKSELPVLFQMLHTSGLKIAMKQVGVMVAKLLLIDSIVFVLVGVADYFVQKRQFKEQMKMTKQEVKEEYKEMEGDPEVKNHLESAQREMLSQNIPRAVREADVVITNPTHFAVALQWKRDIGDAPQVTAKGEDMNAQNIKRLAREYNVPIVENKPLARGLYHDTKVGDIIPEIYLRAIATIYAQIGYMEKQKRK